MEDGRLAGILTRNDLLVALANHGEEYPVGGAMNRDSRELEENEMLQDAMQRLQECNGQTLPVSRRGELAGLLTLENEGEYLRINSALRRAEAAASLNPL